MPATPGRYDPCWSSGTFSQRAKAIAGRFRGNVTFWLRVLSGRVGTAWAGRLPGGAQTNPLAWLAVPEVRLRCWRMSDLDRVARMTNDDYLRPWWWMADDLRAWLRREITEERGPTRAICLPGDDRALGRVAVRLPEFASEAVRCAAVQASDQPAGELSYWLLPDARGRGLAFTAVGEMMKIAADAGLKSLVLDIEEENAASIRVAEHLGAERRTPTRRHADRFGHDWTMVVYVLPV